MSHQHFKTTCLDLHNELRARHGASPLEWSYKLQRDAKEYATSIFTKKRQKNQSIDNDTIERCPNVSWGQNIFQIKLDGSFEQMSDLTAVTSAINAWYEEIDEYNWSHPPDPSSYSSSLSFSQLIWMATTKVGIGIGRNVKMDRIIVIAFYDKPGNIRGSFFNNVKRPLSRHRSRQSLLGTKFEPESNWHKMTRDQDVAFRTGNLNADRIIPDKTEEIKKSSLIENYLIKPTLESESLKEPNNKDQEDGTIHSKESVSTVKEDPTEPTIQANGRPVEGEWSATLENVKNQQLVDDSNFTKISAQEFSENESQNIPDHSEIGSTITSPWPDGSEHVEGIDNQNFIKKDDHSENKLQDDVDNQTVLLDEDGPIRTLSETVQDIPEASDSLNSASLNSPTQMDERKTPDSLGLEEEDLGSSWRDFRPTRNSTNEFSKFETPVGTKAGDLKKDDLIENYKGNVSCEWSDAEEYNELSLTPEPPMPSFIVTALHLHNEFRMTHGSPGLKIDEKLCLEAQRLAQSLADYKSEQDLPENVGRNVYRLTMTPNKDYHDNDDDMTDVVETAVMSWYRQRSEYNWTEPLSSTSPAQLFTQLIWKDSKDLAVGVAFSRDKKFVAVVCLYSPAGNIYSNKSHRVNVHPAVS